VLSVSFLPFGMENHKVKVRPAQAMRIRGILKRDPVLAAAFGAIVGAYAGRILDGLLSNCFMPPLSWLPYGVCSTIGYLIIFPVSVGLIAMILLFFFAIGEATLNAILHREPAG
jgi:hypothetical protein